MAYRLSYSDYPGSGTSPSPPAPTVPESPGYRLEYSDYASNASGPPDPDRWVGPPGPQGPPGPPGPQGPAGGGYTLPVASTTVLGGVKIDGASIHIDGSGVISVPATGVLSFNSRTGAIVLASADVTTALTFTPYNATNPAGFISGNQAITLSGDVTGSGATAIAATLANTTVVAASYTYASLTVDAKGRLTAASSGAAPAAPSSTTPIMDGTATIGAGTTYARADHVHPVDTSRYAATNPAGYQTAAQVTTALAPYAPLASPVLTGDPQAPTPSPGDNDTSIATTAFVTAAMTAAGSVNPSNALPIIDGTAAAGSSALYARGDHVHPTDTSRYAATNPSGYQTAAQVTTTLAGYLPLTGGTLSGALTGTAMTISGAFLAQTGGIQAGINTSGAGGFISVNGSVSMRYVQFLTASSLRVRMGINGTAEGGSNAGSDFFLNTYSDTGTQIGAAISITRATMAIALGGPLTLAADPTVALGAATKQMVDLKASLASPALTGTPTAPTAAQTDSSTTLATTAFVRTGTATNNNAAAGQIGEFLTVTGSSTALTTATPTTLATLSLTAGDWDVWGGVLFAPAATTTMSTLQCGPSLTAALPSLANGQVTSSVAFTTGGNQILHSGHQRVSIAGTTSVNIVANAAFATSTMNATGYLSARRMR